MNVGELLSMESDKIGCPAPHNHSRWLSSEFRSAEVLNLCLLAVRLSYSGKLSKAARTYF